jgi:hypothetical protein
MTRGVAVCWLALVGVPALGADLEPTRLSLGPAELPSPVLRYRLLPDLVSQEPGNAADIYQKALPLLQRLGGGDAEQLGAWQEMPLDQLPRDEVRGVLGEYREALALVDRAARREYCDWGVAERLRKQGIGALLPEVQPLRQAALLLAVRARLEMAEGQLPDACRTLQTGLALARHVGGEPTLINALVGCAITAIMARQAEELIQQDGAPNLYWALTDLPRPFISLRRPLQGERLAAYGTFQGLAPMAADLRARPLTPEQVQAITKGLPGLLEIGRFPAASRFLLGLAIRARHETAKRVLVAQGRPRELVERMPHVQVALLHALADYDRQLDEMARWESFPYWQARPHLERAVQPTAPWFPPAVGPALPLARLLLPAVNRVFLAQARTDRRIAALRVLEALRLHAARHQGRFPPVLDAIKEVPVPIDPVTGRGFEYHVSGNRATLYGPPPHGEQAGPGNALSYELTLRR